MQRACVWLEMHRRATGRGWGLETDAVCDWRLEQPQPQAAGSRQQAVGDSSLLNALCLQALDWLISVT